MMRPRWAGYVEGIAMHYAYFFGEAKVPTAA
jgi:hypothetical protein